MEVEWPLERALKAADDAVGAPVMTELYAQMKSAPVEPDLNALWKTLGVEERAGGVAFNDNAPEASIRRAITVAPRTDSQGQKPPTTSARNLTP